MKKDKYKCNACKSKGACYLIVELDSMFPLFTPPDKCPLGYEQVEWKRCEHIFTEKFNDIMKIFGV